MFTATSEQQAVIDSVLAGENTVVNSTAGSGKSATAKHIIEKALKDGKDVIATSFSNVAIDELRVDGAWSLTTTKIGYAIIKQWYFNENQNRRKYYKPNKKFDKYTYLTRKVLKEEGYDKKESTAMIVGGLRSLIDEVRQYNVAQDATEYVNVWNMKRKDPYPFEYDNIVYKVIEQGIERFVWNCSMDFIDCIWLPNVIECDLEGWRYYTGHKSEYIEVLADRLLIVADEVQDLCKSEIDMLLQFCTKHDAQILGIGDLSQAIYGFRSGIGDAFTHIEQFVSINRLAVNTTFRCPKSHTKYIRERMVGFGDDVPVQPLEANIHSYHEDEGNLHLVATVEEALKHVVPGQTLITGRNVRGTDSMIMHAVRVILETTDYTLALEGFNFVKLTERLLKTMRRLGLKYGEQSMAIERIINEELDKMEEDNNYYCDIHELRGELDFASLIVGMCKDCYSVSDIEYFVEEMFNNDDADIILGTTFRIKGKTYPTVIALESGPCYDERNTKMLNGQETNVYFVALSRSNDTLVLL